MAEEKDSGLHRCSRNELDSSIVHLVHSPSEGSNHSIDSATAMLNRVEPPVQQASHTSAARSNQHSPSNLRTRSITNNAKENTNRPPLEVHVNPDESAALDALTSFADMDIGQSFAKGVFVKPQDVIPLKQQSTSPLFSSSKPGRSSQDPKNNPYLFGRILSNSVDRGYFAPPSNSDRIASRFVNPVHVSTSDICNTHGFGQLSYPATDELSPQDYDPSHHHDKFRTNQMLTIRPPSGAGPSSAPFSNQQLHFPAPIMSNQTENGNKITVQSSMDQGTGLNKSSEKERKKPILLTREAHEIPPITDDMSPEEKHKIRAERNRLSAKLSRERMNKKESDLDRAAYFSRPEGEKLRDSSFAMRKMCLKAIASVQKNFSADEAAERVKKYQEIIDRIDKAMVDCPWTFRSPDAPVTSLKYNPNEQK